MKQYVLEWSKKSNSFHVQPIETTLAKNQECFLKDTSHDYIVLMVGTHDVITNMADHHRERLIERERVVA
jgi:hypothetical protein